MADVFGFRPGRSIRGVDPQRAAQELERIREEQGALKPESVVEAAADPASPLHAAFEWDDSAAAQQYRLTQARRLIVSVRVLNSPVQAPIPMYVSVRSAEHGRSYLPAARALTDEELRARVLDEIRQFVETLERKYHHFREASDLLGRLRQAAG